MHNDIIMILRNSPYNEDYILDMYATNDAELAQIAAAYFMKYFFYGEDTELDIEIDHDKKQVHVSTIDGDVWDKEFYITYVSRFSTDL